MANTISLDELIARASTDPKGLVQLASVLFKLGDAAQARLLARHAMKAAPEDGEIARLASPLLARGVPRWHFMIVRDVRRNAAYEDALKRAISPETRVLEIGAGSAILAMMAARAGAASVVTCEAVPTIAETAEEIVALNGYADRVRVVAKKSGDLDPVQDMGGPADILVSEIVGNRLIGEDVLPVIEDAVSRLLKPGAKIIPSRGIVRVALARDPQIRRARMDTIDGFDLSPFNRLAPPSYLARQRGADLALISMPADLFDFDFQSGGPFPAATASATLTSTGGEANGIAQWIALQFDEEGWYENAPSAGAVSAWAVVFWPFPAPRDYPAGTQVEVFGQHDRKRMQVWA